MWNWSNFDFEGFIQRLSFENIKKDSLEKSIEASLIKTFEISTDNISLFANGVKLLCFDKMESRGEISHHEITQCIEEIKFDIVKALNQREESIDGQLRECMEFAKYNEMTVVNTYIDRALSAKTDNRPEFQRMIKDSYKCNFDVVIVWNRSAIMQYAIFSPIAHT